jgi:hypothetical protein
LRLSVAQSNNLLNVCRLLSFHLLVNKISWNKTLAQGETILFTFLQHGNDVLIGVLRVESGALNNTYYTGGLLWAEHAGDWSLLLRRVDRLYRIQSKTSSRIEGRGKVLLRHGSAAIIEEELNNTLSILTTMFRDDVASELQIALQRSADLVDLAFASKLACKLVLFPVRLLAIHAAVLDQPAL